MVEKLRHGLKYLWPSEIAEQYYCEYKVHLKRLHPEVKIELPALESGEVNHSALISQARSTTPIEIARAIQNGKNLAICECVLEGNFQSVRIRGRPDCFAFEGQKALLLLDFKFGTTKKPFRDHEVQTEIYGLLAEAMAFSTQQLYLGIVLIPSAGLSNCLRNAGSTKAATLKFLNENGTLQNIYEQCEQLRNALLAGQTKQTTIETNYWKVFLFKFNANKAAKDLSWALSYWLGEREPIPVRRRPQKCVACALNALGLCKHALKEPHVDFRVQHNPDGRIFVYRDRQDY